MFCKTLVSVIDMDGNVKHIKLNEGQKCLKASESY